MGRGKMGPEERKQDFYVNIFFFPYLVFITAVYPSCISLDYLSLFSLLYSCISLDYLSKIFILIVFTVGLLYFFLN